MDVHEVPGDEATAADTATQKSHSSLSTSAKTDDQRIDNRAESTFRKMTEIGKGKDCDKGGDKGGSGKGGDKGGDEGDDKIGPLPTISNGAGIFHRGPACTTCGHHHPDPDREGSTPRRVTRARARTCRSSKPKSKSKKNMDKERARTRSKSGKGVDVDCAEEEDKGHDDGDDDDLDLDLDDLDLDLDPESESASTSACGDCGHDHIHVSKSNHAPWSARIGPLDPVEPMDVDVTLAREPNTDYSESDDDVCQDCGWVHAVEGENRKEGESGSESEVEVESESEGETGSESEVESENGSESVPVVSDPAPGPEEDASPVPEEEATPDPLPSSRIFYTYTNPLWEQRVVPKMTGNSNPEPEVVGTLNTTTTTTTTTTTQEVAETLDIGKMDLTSALQFRHLGKIIGCGVKVDLSVVGAGGHGQGQGQEGHVEIHATLKIGLRYGPDDSRVRLGNCGTFRISRVIRNAQELHQVPVRFWKNVSKLRIISGTGGALASSSISEIAQNSVKISEIYGEVLDPAVNPGMKEIIAKNWGTLRKLEVRNDVLDPRKGFDCSLLRNCGLLEEVRLSNLAVKGLTCLPVGLTLLKIHAPVSVADVEEVQRKLWNLRVLHLEIDELLGTTKLQSFKDVTQFANNAMCLRGKGNAKGPPGGRVMSQKVFQDLANHPGMADLVLVFWTHFYEPSCHKWGHHIPNYQYTPLKTRLDGWKTDFLENGRTDVVMEVEVEERSTPPPPPPLTSTLSRGGVSGCGYLPSGKGIKGQNVPTVIKVSVRHGPTRVELQAMNEAEVDVDMN